MRSVAEAELIVLSHARHYGVEMLPFQSAQGRILAENVAADRDLPPYDRVTMDGIAIRYADYEAGCRHFTISAIQAAGDAPVSELAANACIEIMTGAALSTAADTVIPYEHLNISEGIAHLVQAPLEPGRNIHRQGKDRRRGEVVMSAGRIIGAPEISMAASVGKSDLQVRKLPRTVILSSGDELVDVSDTPLPYQIRRSNNYAMQAVLRTYGIDAAMLHLPDQPELIRQEIARCLQAFDLVILSGGISMGKFDYIPQALLDSGVQMHFDKVRQRPGKPFQFGTFGERGVVFALPGNPVSTFLCLHRYVLPWLERSLGFPERRPELAILENAVHFEPNLTYFMQVKLRTDDRAQLWATPVEGQGSGDFSNLLDADAFLELPAERTDFGAGEIFRVWRFG
jgi:molybdopterin molybdotransferase